MIDIAAACIEDYEAICRVFSEADDLHREALPDIFQKPDGPCRPMSWLQSYLDEKHKQIFVARREREIVGVLEMEEKSASPFPMFRPRRYAIVHGLSVAAKARRMGVGTTLMESAKEWANKRNVESIELSVWAFNQSAIELYHKLGYQTIRNTMEIKL